MSTTQSYKPLLNIVSSHNSKAIVKKVAIRLIIGVFLLFLLFPIYWMIVTSFKTNLEIYKIPPQWIPLQPTLDNYLGVFVDNNFLIYFMNNLYVSVGTTILTSFAAVFAGYSLSRYRSRLGNVVNTGLLSTQMFPVVGILLALYMIFRDLHLINTRMALVISLSAVTIPFSTLLIKGFFDDIPKSMEEAAKIDGCSRLGILYRIVIPLSKPGLLAIGVFTFMQSWNDYLFAITLIVTNSKRTLSAGISLRYLGEVSYDWAQVATVSVVGALPMFILIFIFQRYMIKGLTAGAVKG
ncbi:MAG: carbohydrate ABC transporter permease [Proteiniphilum sp.]|nr:carbohydrate ABC transporter permease [Proteiniphilum sp.]